MEAEEDRDDDMLTGAEAMLAALDGRISAAARELQRSATSSATASNDATLRELYEQRRRVASKLPNFWLRVLLNHPAFALHLTATDAQLLQSLSHLDVSAVDAPHNFTLTFHFSPNALLAVPALRKRYSFSERCGRVVQNDTASWLVSPPSSGFAFWLTVDTVDSAHLGELLRYTVYPRATDLYFNTYTLAEDDDTLSI